MARGRCWSGVEAHLAWISTAITRHAPWQPSDEHARLWVDPLTHPAVRQDIVNDLVGFEVEPDQPLMEAGLDSIGAPDTSMSCVRFTDMLHVQDSRSSPGLGHDANVLLTLCTAGAVELRNNVNAKFGIDLPATATFDHPTSSALAAYIASNVTPAVQVRAALTVCGCAGTVTMSENCVQAG